jgi:hypothetical protein
MDHCTTLIVPVEKLLSSEYKFIQHTDTYRYIIESTLGFKDDQTLLYKHLQDLFNKGISGSKLFGINSLKGIVKRLRCVDGMTNDFIKGNSSAFPLIEVIIDDMGNIVLWEGNNRAAVYAYVGMKGIPARVVNRSKRWLDFKDMLACEYSEKKLYNPIVHPDFADWDIMNQPLRFVTIRNKLTNLIEPVLGPTELPDNYNMLVGGTYRVEKELRHTSMLDLCCHYGYMSHSFRNIGYDVTGVELNRQYYYGAKYLNHYNNHYVEFINADIFWFADNIMVNTDVVLLLNIMYKIMDRTEDSIALLNKIGDFSTIFVTDYTPDKNLSMTQFKSYISKNTGMKFDSIVYFNPVNKRTTMIFLKGKV